MKSYIKAPFLRLFFLVFAGFFCFSVVAHAQEPTFKELLERSQAGDVVAMRELGTAYGEGRLVEKRDFKQAAYWLEKAATGGDRDAMSKIGWLYDQGDGVEQNLTTAIKWYEKAAELGDSVACYNLGYIYEQGRGVGRSYEEAFKWYKKGAELGDPTSMEVVIAYYKAGLGVPKDVEKAGQWQEKLKQANENKSEEEDLDILRQAGFDDSAIDMNAKAEQDKSKQDDAEKAETQKDEPKKDSAKK